MIQNLIAQTDNHTIEHPYLNADRYQNTMYAMVMRNQGHDNSLDARKKIIAEIQKILDDHHGVYIDKSGARYFVVIAESNYQEILDGYPCVLVFSNPHMGSFRLLPWTPHEAKMGLMRPHSPVQQSIPWC